MDRKKILLYIFVLLLGVLIARGLLSVFSKPYEIKSAKVAIPENISSQPIVKAPVKKIPPPSSLPAANTAVTVKPEAPPAIEIKKPQPPVLILNGIVFAVDDSYALINNQIVRQGEKIEGASVLKIDQDSVELQFDNINFKLTPQQH